MSYLKVTIAKNLSKCSQNFYFLCLKIRLQVILGNSNSHIYRVLKPLLALLKPKELKAWEHAWLFERFNFERNYGALKSMFFVE